MLLSSIVLINNWKIGHVFSVFLNMCLWLIQGLFVVKGCHGIVVDVGSGNQCNTRLPLLPQLESIYNLQSAQLYYPITEYISFEYYTVFPLKQ